jgi:RNA polymerase sigma factor (sigma-70 family)
MTDTDKKDGVTSIFIACRGLLAKAVRRIVRNNDVDDILQEAFLRTFEAEARYPIRDARAFLLRTARNVALDHVGRAAYKRTGSIDSVDEELFPDDAPLPEVQVEAEQRFISFCEAVGSLPQQCRRTFVLKKVYGLSHEEISQRLGIAESTIEKHVAKGLLLCHEYLNAKRNAPKPPRSMKP